MGTTNDFYVKRRNNECGDAVLCDDDEVSQSSSSATIGRRNQNLNHSSCVVNDFKDKLSLYASPTQETECSSLPHSFSSSLSSTTSPSTSSAASSSIYVSKVDARQDFNSDSYSHENDYSCFSPKSSVFVKKRTLNKIDESPNFWTDEMEDMLTLRRANPIYDATDSSCYDLIPNLHVEPFREFPLQRIHSM